MTVPFHPVLFEVEASEIGFLRSQYPDGVPRCLILFRSMEVQSRPKECTVCSMEVGRYSQLSILLRSCGSVCAIHWLEFNNIEPKLTKHPFLMIYMLLLAKGGMSGCEIRDTMNEQTSDNALADARCDAKRSLQSFSSNLPMPLSTEQQHSTPLPRRNCFHPHPRVSISSFVSFAGNPLTPNALTWVPLLNL